MNNFENITTSSYDDYGSESESSAPTIPVTEISESVIKIPKKHHEKLNKYSALPLNKLDINEKKETDL